MAPRGPGVLGVLLVLTLGAMFYCGRVREPDVSSPPIAPSGGAGDAGTERSPAHENRY